MTADFTPQEMRQLTRKDVQRMIGAIMASPMFNAGDEVNNKKMGEVKEFDGKKAFMEISSGNLTVGSKMLANLTKQAINGDVKSAELLMKYGGYTPVVETQVEFTLPTFVDDMSLEKDVTDQVEVVEQKEIEAPKKEKEKEDVITDTEDVKVVDITRWGM